MILVADDDIEDQEMLAEYLTARGVNRSDVKFVTNGKSLLDYLENSEQKPRLIVLDLKMPIMDGQTTLMHLKNDARSKSIPVVMYSTSSNDTDKRKCLATGAMGYFVKPASYVEGEAMADEMMKAMEQD